LLFSATAMTTATGMPATAATWVAADVNSAATDVSAATAMKSATAPTTNIAAADIAATIRGAAIVGAVVIAAVVEIAVAADQSADHAGDDPADNRLGNDVATMAIANLLDLRGGLHQLRTGDAGHAGQSGRRREHHPGSDNCCNSNTVHLMIPFL